MSERRRMLVTPHYVEIEYLQSTGTQYINSEIECGRNISFIVDGNYTENENDVNFGSNVYPGNIQRFHFGIYSGKFFFGIGNVINYTIIFDFNRHLFELNGSGYAKFDNTQFTLAEYQSSYNKLDLFLFARNLSGTADTFSKFRLYSSRIFENNVALRDYIPVRVGQVGYLYDKVSGQLFGNAGTGNFILGPDVN